MNETEGTKANRRRHLGRRASDWLLPLLLSGLAILALLWAVDSYNKRKQLEAMNKAIATQAQLLERILKNEEKAQAKAAASPTSTPAPTVIGRKMPAAKARP